ncbi:lysophospholipid acyltransferase family protein [Geomonas nitrogeniifigens]|uniref:Lysophospholipid acyltransferase family protein n=1 Tax=Geomonas diazotrophica TaxID=2843197 RepID=A0ABX8JNQ2_9BACT|nr:lysophospholipid acyltransferase family protein [Geomonas nitrogeniifigens]QWV98791.1 lysophospholipid acyltransferase family protein [Geomonas nitrogeniifigens]QXE87948.1 lysophospholipid acyltransferase family protein [Geomonas nitrogeniifigens]
MQQTFWRLQAALFYSLTLAGALIPAAALQRLGGMVGYVLWSLLPRRRAIVMDNLKHALPYLNEHPLWRPPGSQATSIASENYANLGKSLIEICQLYHGRGDHLIAGIELRGLEHYETARAKGKGIICFSGHCGNWELMALAFSRLFGDGVVVARRQNNPFFNQMVERMRMSYRSRVIYKKGAFRGILSALRSGELVGILADQAAGPEDGVLVTMMGRKAWATKAPVLIARKSGAPLLPVFIHREGERHVITFYPEHHFSGDMSDHGIQKETQALSRYVENFVAAHPTQWYWMHRRWKRAGEASA